MTARREVELYSGLAARVAAVVEVLAQLKGRSPEAFPDLKAFKVDPAASWADLRVQVDNMVRIALSAHQSRALSAKDRRPALAALNRLALIGHVLGVLDAAALDPARGNLAALVVAGARMHRSDRAIGAFDDFLWGPLVSSRGRSPKPDFSRDDEAEIEEHGLVSDDAPRAAWLAAATALFANGKGNSINSILKRLQMRVRQMRLRQRNI